MPCFSYGPSRHEEMGHRVMVLLNEVGLSTAAPEYTTVNIDANTAALCTFCKNNDTTKYSYDLQIWWLEHQRDDAKRLEEENASALRFRFKESALAKLTPQERESLGL